MWVIIFWSICKIKVPRNSKLVKKKKKKSAKLNAAKVSCSENFLPLSSIFQKVKTQTEQNMVR